MAEITLPEDTVALDEETKTLDIIDQTLLPGEIKILKLATTEEIFEAVRMLRVRGAPAIGVAAAMGVYLAMLETDAKTYGEFYGRFTEAKNYLASSRPTAVNLFWALGRMEKIVLDNEGKDPAELRKLLRDEALRIRDEDVRTCRAIGEYGLELLKDGDGILTHCNAGRLAAVRYGTALAPVHLGRERGMNFRVFCDETRPLLQGARLSALEMSAAGADTTLICDGAAGEVMKKGLVNVCFVGCDRAAANGDAANKIGTSGLAVVARHYGIPFYVFAPSSSIDMTVKDGGGIVIEERDGREITETRNGERVAPEGVRVFNPAFDVTDNALITAFVTEYGVIKPPYSGNFKTMFGR